MAFAIKKFPPDWTGGKDVPFGRFYFLKIREQQVSAPSALANSD
jgi:hypothetical protein